MLDLKRLRVLRAVAEHGSFSAAADELYVSQSAVSQQIANLEAEVGEPLVLRLRGGPVLTDAGRVLVAHAESAMARLEQAERDLASLSGLETGELRMVSFASASATVVTEAISRFRDAHPGIRISLTEAEPEEALPALWDPPAEQFARNYIGGWRPLKGFTLGADGTLCYPGDSPLLPLAETRLRGEVIRLYECEWVVIIQPDGSVEVSLMD